MNISLGQRDDGRWQVTVDGVARWVGWSEEAAHQVYAAIKSGAPDLRATEAELRGKALGRVIARAA